MGHATLTTRSQCTGWLTHPSLQAKAASVLKGIAKVAAVCPLFLIYSRVHSFCEGQVDMDQHQAVGAPYNVKGFPTIKVKFYLMLALLPPSYLDLF